MNDADTTNDPWRVRLSEHVDGELDARERALLETHLAGCASCRTLLDELRALRTAAGALADRGPARDLWPELRAALAPAPARRWPAWAAAFAAGVLATLGATAALRSRRDDGERVAQASWMLLLHETPAAVAPTPAEHAAIVERYARWARALGARCTGGEELAEQGLVLRPAPLAPSVAPLAEGERVGGFFLLDVADEAEALELARTCPHLENGGWVELRRINVQPR